MTDARRGREGARALHEAAQVRRAWRSSPTSHGKELSDPAFAPFWKKAEELGALVMIHPNGFTQADRLSRFYFNNVIGNPLDTTVALHYLIFDGVLERHPKLEDLRGAWRRLSRRLFGPHRPRLGRARGFARQPAEAADALSQEDLFRHRGVHAGPARGAGEDLSAWITWCMGTDYPFDMADFDPIEHVVSTGFDAAATAAICGGNAKKLLGL